MSNRVAILAWLSLLAIPLALYATMIEPFRLQLEWATVKVPIERRGSLPIAIGILADLQTSEVTLYEHSAVDRLMAEGPDLILLPGDLFQASSWGQGGREFEEQLPKIHTLLGKLHAPGGVFIVLGNVDRAEALRRAVSGTSVRLLVNESVSVEVGDRRITIGGLELNVRGSGARGTISELEARAGKDDIRILLSHMPDSILVTRPGGRIDLVVAGHTHGGQVRLPLLGPLITLSETPRRIGSGGLEIFRGNKIYVSRGVGLERGQAPRLRFLCPPEITLLRLE